MKKLKKIGLAGFNLTLIAAVAYFVFQAVDDYIQNPWTRDGQVRGHVIQVSPRVSGMVQNIAVVDNQFVKAGDLLFQIDSEPFEIATAQAEANLNRQKINSRGRKIEYDRLNEIHQKDSGAISEKDLIRRETSYNESLSNIDAAVEQLRGAHLNQSYTEVFASVDGYVSNINFQVGTQAVANNPIMALVDSNSFWVFGYFRESQIGDITLGDTARVTLMAYPDTPLGGHVESLGWGIAPSDGTVGYNLLPSIKPVFQWIRLAQRIPVRIALDEIPQDVELRFGLTASVMIMAPKK
ncbi:MAG: HlyD family secretion protein [Halioglobus sp.]